MFGFTNSCSNVLGLAMRGTGIRNRTKVTVGYNTGY